MNTTIKHAEDNLKIVVTGQEEEIRPGRKLHVAFHEGSQQPETVFFLCHGGGGNKNQWRHQWLALTQAGYSVVAWDFIGHGSSVKPKDPAYYHGNEFLADYLAIFDRYRRHRNILVGHSYGGATTVRLLQHLQAAGRLSDVDQAAVLGTPFPDGSTTLPLVRLPLFLLKLLKPLLAAKFRRLAWDPSASAALVKYEEAIASSNPVHVFRALLTQAQWFDPAALASLQLPITVLAGESDGLAPPTRARRLADGLPNARFEVLTQCGHQIMLEKPQEVDHALLAIATAA